jgi:hypothetical protein
MTVFSFALTANASADGCDVESQTSGFELIELQCWQGCEASAGKALESLIQALQCLSSHFAASICYVRQDTALGSDRQRERLLVPSICRSFVSRLTEYLDFYPSAEQHLAQFTASALRPW